jgi:PST family polysaccharide transporter
MEMALSEPAPNFRRTASRGAFAAGLQQLVKTGLQILTAVTLSRLLTPDTFGVYAMVTPVASFVGMFQDMGLSQAVIQRKELGPGLVNRLYWLNLTATGVIALVLLAISPIVGWFYHDDRVILLTAALAVPLIIGGISFQHYAVMMRDMRFQRLALIDICCATAQFAVVVGAAWWLRSYWAFWISGVASVTLYGILASRSSGWKPGKPTLRGDTGGALRFGAHLTGANLVGYFARNLDNVLVGRYWGPVQLGLYDRAYKLLLFPLQNINGPLTRVMMPVLSRLQSEPERMRQAYYRYVALVNLLAMPGVAIAIAAPNETIALLFGVKWLATANIFAWLGAVALFQPMTATMGVLLLAKGNSRKVFWLQVAVSIAAILSFVIGLPDGGLGVARAYTIEEYLFRLPLTLWAVTRGGDARVRDLLLRWAPLMVAAGATYLIAIGLRHLGLTGVVLLIVTGLASYLTAVALTAMSGAGRKTLQDIWTMVHEVLIWVKLRKSPAA